MDTQTYHHDVLFQENPVPLMLIDHDFHKILKVNQAATNKFGYSKDELLDMEMPDLRFKEDQRVLPVPDYDHNVGHFIETVCRSKTKERESIVTDILARSIRYKEKEVLYAAIRDLTDYKSVEARIISAQSAAIEAERESIAQEIHDGVVQTLTASLLNFNALSDKLPQDKGIRDQYMKALNFLNSSISDVRDISHNLMPKSVKDYILNELIHDLIVDFKQTVNITIDFTNELPEFDVTDKIKLNMYRFLQEALSNIKKHSNASRVVIKLILNKRNKIELTIVDDGVGFDETILSNKKRGIGLRNLRNRTILVDGILNIYSKINQGTKIVLRIPLVELNETIKEP